MITTVQYHASHVTGLYYLGLYAVGYNQQEATPLTSSINAMQAIVFKLHKAGPKNFAANHAVIWFLDACTIRCMRNTVVHVGNPMAVSRNYCQREVLPKNPFPPVFSQFCNLKQPTQTRSPPRASYLRRAPSSIE